ncbi:hypothetical protein M0802_004832 [Mischocyttarus mexicanus]|nr:hypothetical protein M0802_004832 [Mischocyttarus mexicanus]
MVKRGSKSVCDCVSNSSSSSSSNGGVVLGPTPSQYLRVAVGHFTTLIGSAGRARLKDEEERERGGGGEGQTSLDPGLGILEECKRNVLSIRKDGTRKIKMCRFYVEQLPKILSNV